MHPSSILSGLQTHREQILALAQKHGLRNIRIFGSVARGEDTAESDIDFLVDVAEPITEPFGCVRFQREVEALLGRPVDIVFDGYIFAPLQERILRESRPL